MFSHGCNIFFKIISQLLIFQEMSFDTLQATKEKAVGKSFILLFLDSHLLDSMMYVLYLIFLFKFSVLKKNIANLYK